MFTLGKTSTQSNGNSLENGSHTHGLQVPKKHAPTDENLRGETATDCSEQQRAKLLLDLDHMSAKQLRLTYAGEYSSWRNAKSRSKSNPHIKGKTWDDEFETFAGFLRYVGPKPTSDLTLDRIDPEQGYIRNNIRWASKQLQSENRLCVKLFTVGNEHLTLSQLAKMAGISYDKARRLIRQGKTATEIVEQSKAASRFGVRGRVLYWPWRDNPVGEKWEVLYRKDNTGETRPDYYLRVCRETSSYWHKKSCQEFSIAAQVSAKTRAECDNWDKWKAHAIEQHETYLRQEKLQPEDPIAVQRRKAGLGPRPSPHLSAKKRIPRFFRLFQQAIAASVSHSGECQP